MPNTDLSRYRKVPCRLMIDPEFVKRSDDYQAVYLHLYLTPLGNHLGCYRAGIAALAEEKGWDDPDRYRTAMNEGGENIKYDERTRVVLLRKFIEENPPANPNVLKNMVTWYNEVPDCPLKAEFYDLLEAVCSAIDEKGSKNSFTETFHEFFAKPFVEPFVEPFEEPSAKDMAKQKQKQEAVEQEQEAEHTSAQSASVECADQPPDNQPLKTHSLPGRGDPPDGAAIHEFRSGRWFWGTEDDLEIAEYIRDCVLKKFPETKEPNMAVWSNDVRLMRIADERDLKHIRMLWDWAHADEGDGNWPGWSVNVRSPDKLRSKWPELVIRRNQTERGNNGQANKRRSAGDQLEEQIAERDRRDRATGNGSRVIDLAEGPDGFSVERDDRPIRGIVDR